MHEGLQRWALPIWWSSPVGRRQWGQGVAPFCWDGIGALPLEMLRNVVFHGALCKCQCQCKSVYPRSTNEFTRTGFRNIRAFQDRIGIWKCWSLSRGENRSTRRITSLSRVENQQQTQPTYDAGSSNPGHKGGRRALSPLRHSFSLVCSRPNFRATRLLRRLTITKKKSAVWNIEQLVKSAKYRRASLSECF